MKQHLAEAVTATFREYGQADLYCRLAVLSDRDWRRSLHWLDASGLALYFLHRLKALGLKEVLPPDVLSGLESRLADNKLRSDHLFEEFLRINEGFQAAGINYVNLKGFTLIPDYCPDPRLRCQFDLDFLVNANDTDCASDILRRFGYTVTGRADDVLEFKADSARLPSIRDLYKSRAGRSVEIHHTSTEDHITGFSPEVLSKSRNIYRQAGAFPALSDTDAFLAQARHLLRHVRSEWTRLSWLLEFKAFVSSRRNNTAFWNTVRAQAQYSTDDKLAIGVALWLATRAFGSFAPPDLVAWSVGTLPAAVLLWLERCGETVLFSDFPGTKLYLLLNKALSPHHDCGRNATIGKLFPMHRPPRVIASTDRGFRRSGYRLVVQVKYTLFRLRFHLRATWQYLMEARRWERVSQASQQEQRLLPSTVVDVSSVALDR